MRSFKLFSVLSTTIFSIGLSFTCHSALAQSTDQTTVTASAQPPVQALEQPLEDAPALPNLNDRYMQWASEAFSFEAKVKNVRRSTPAFEMTIDEVRYSVLFDAGRAKRNAILDCLELSDVCDVTGKAYMFFDKGVMKMNVSDITFLAIPEIDFDEMASRFHRCVRYANDKRKSFASIVEIRLDVNDIARPPNYAVTPIKPRDGGRGFELVLEAVRDCMRRNIRLPVGSYSLKVYTQSSDAFLDHWEE